MIKPASYLRIKARNEFYWEAEQDFIRLGSVVTVRAWGFSRRDALQALERAKIEADQPIQQPFKALFDTLWTMAGSIDSLMKLLTAIHVRLMTGK